MIMSLFKKDGTRDTALALYNAAVDQARNPIFYADFGGPDTVEGRFEQITLHVWLVLRALKAGGQETSKLSQAVLDVMFENMDHSLRELGVGDLSVGKKVRRLAESFFGRVGAYEKALEADADPADLATALGRNVYEDEAASGASALAAYVRNAAAIFHPQSDAGIVKGLIAGRINFPMPEKKLEQA